MAMAHGFARGRQVSWNVGVAAAAKGRGVPFYVFSSASSSPPWAAVRLWGRLYQITGLECWWWSHGGLCHSGVDMPVDSFVAGPARDPAEFVLGVDTCGPSGSVGLGRICGISVEIMGQKELAGRSYSSTLVIAVAELLAECGATLRNLWAIVVVAGPGSFTGVRVGLSAVKGLAGPSEIPVTPVSRLEVLAWKAQVLSAALDAHRHEVFLRVGGEETEAREQLAGIVELRAIQPPRQVAVCEEEAAALLTSVWPNASLLRTDAPTAADAMQYAAARVLEGKFADLALLDGHYLRRSDAEIFGQPDPNPPTQPKGESCSRP
jgi:tRNA threonylcarbamoyladenosine biosynthesis protein TsaB